MDSESFNESIKWLANPLLDDALQQLCALHVYADGASDLVDILRALLRTSHDAGIK
jgi:hypothetical protein